jgi:amino-acid N-acetyltransferase
VTKETKSRAARPPDLAALRALLESAELPEADLTTAHLGAFHVAEDGQGRLVGGVGLELAGDAALLRSLVVAPERRGTGLGHALVEAALGLADERGVAEVWLLTTTADRFFERLGWRRVERASAPAGIRATAEFASICPASSVCMVRDLQGSRREVPA